MVGDHHLINYFWMSVGTACPRQPPRCQVGTPVVIVQCQSVDVGSVQVVHAADQRLV